MCALLPSPLSDTCKQIVEGDLSTLIEKLVKKEDPGTVCAELKACSQKGIVFNQFLTNGLANHYHLWESIFNARGIRSGSVFNFSFIAR